MSEDIVRIPIDGYTIFDISVVEMGNQISISGNRLIDKVWKPVQRHFSYTYVTTDQIKDHWLETEDNILIVHIRY
jgi:hypothetical protein